MAITTYLCQKTVCGFTNKLKKSLSCNRSTIHSATDCREPQRACTHHVITSELQIIRILAARRWLSGDLRLRGAWLLVQKHWPECNLCAVRIRELESVGKGNLEEGLLHLLRRLWYLQAWGTIYA